MNFASQHAHAALASHDFGGSATRSTSRTPSFGLSHPPSDYRASTPSDTSEHRKRNRTNSDTSDPQHRSKLARSNSNISPLSDYDSSIASSSNCHQPHAPSAGRLPTPLTPPSSSEGKYFDDAPVPDGRRRSEAWSSSRGGWARAGYGREEPGSGMHAGIRDGHSRSRSLAADEHVLRRFGRTTGAMGDNTRPPHSPKPANSDATLSLKPSSHGIYGQAPEHAPLRRPSLSVTANSKLPAFSQLPEDRLTAVTVVALESIWKCPPPAVPIEPGRKPLYPSEQPLPLDEFVRETIRRSRTPPPIHRLALVYLHRCRHKIHETVLSIRQAADELYQLLVNSPRVSQSARSTYGSQPSTAVNREEAAALWRQCNNPIGDGRKMFLAALMCAWKFMQDSNYSNKAWSKITGLEVSKVSANERIFLEIIDWQLNVTSSYFEQWEARLEKLADETAARNLAAARTPSAHAHAHAPPSPISPELRPDPARRGSLNRSTTEYLPAPGTTEVRVASVAAPSHVSQAPLAKAGTEPTLAGLSLAPPSPGSDGHPDSSRMDVDRGSAMAERDARHSTLVARQRRAPPKAPSAAISLGRRPTISHGEGRTSSIFSNHTLGRTLSHGGISRRSSVGHMGSHSDLHHLSSFARWTPVN